MKKKYGDKAYGSVQYRLAIATAFFNQAGFVPAQLQNAITLSQLGVASYLQDDCSTDRTLEKLHSGEGKHPHVYVSKTTLNSGCRANLASILETANSEYILFKGGDDFVVSSTVHTVLEDIELKPSVDVFIYCCSHVPKEAGFRLSAEPNIRSILELQQCRNYWLMEKNWKTAVDLFETCASIPASLWIQGMVIKTSVAREAGFLPTGDVDDWGLVHNLARLCETRDLNVELRPEIISVLSVVPGSQGQDVARQLLVQLEAINNHWSDHLKKPAALNVLEKKLKQMRNADIDYHQLVDAFKKVFSSLS